MAVTPAPQLLPVNQFDHFYKGGDRIGALRHGPGGPTRPEEWIGSMVTRWGESLQGLSTLADGRLLRDAVREDPQAWLGAAHVARYGASNEVLVKLLDLGQRLPVHYHPNRAFAKEHLGLAHGKTEAWYVLDAPEGGQVGVGFKDAMSRAQVAHWVRDRDSESLLAALQTRVVRPGDALLVPAGLPHTVQDGVFVVELQEPTDLSILLEWQGLAVDGEKDGHLDLGFDLALQALEYGAVSASDLDRLVLPRESIEQAGLHSAMPAQADPYFRLHRLDTSAGAITLPAGFAIVIVLDGSGVLRSSAQSVDVVKGDAVLVPFAAGDWTLDGSAVAMACRPPAVDAPDGP